MQRQLLLQQQRVWRSLLGHMQHSWKPPTPLHLRALLSCSRSCYNFSLAAGKITVYWGLLLLLH
jgi:hypothetical protein